MIDKLLNRVWGAHANNHNCHTLMAAFGERRAYASGKWRDGVTKALTRMC